MSPTTSFVEVAEGVRAAIAAYAHALDDGRTEDVVAAFCPDGTADIPGLGAHRGHDALRAAFGAVEPTTPQRHLVSNTHVTEWGDDEAKATSDLAFALKGEGGWSIVLVGRYHDTLHRHDGAWRFHVRRVEWA